MSTITCSRCGHTGEPAPARRIPFDAQTRDHLAATICAACWKEWEGMEIKVINEYRLNFSDPQHREQMKRSCLEFLKPLQQK